MFGSSKKSMSLAEAVGDQAVRGRSLWRDAYDRFTSNKAAMVCVAILHRGVHDCGAVFCRLGQ